MYNVCCRYERTHHFGAVLHRQVERCVALVVGRLDDVAHLKLALLLSCKNNAKVAR